MRLYELPAAFAEIETMTIDGELTPEAIEKLAGLEMALEKKLDGCCRVMKAFEAEQLAYKAEADRLAKNAQIAANNAKRLKSYMDQAMTALGIEKIDAGLFKLRLQNNPMSCQVDDGIDLDGLPDEFKKISVEPNKKAAIDAFKEGRPLPSGFLVSQTRSLRIS